MEDFHDIRKQGEDNVEQLDKYKRILENLIQQDDEEDEDDNINTIEQTNQQDDHYDMLNNEDVAAYSTIKHNSSQSLGSRRYTLQSNKRSNESSCNNEPIVKLKSLNNDMFYLLGDKQFYQQQEEDDQDDQNNEETLQLPNRIQLEEYNDNYGIDKWEEINKENEINEIESLEFSVKREELFQDNQSFTQMIQNEYHNSPQLSTILNKMDNSASKRPPIAKPSRTHRQKKSMDKGSKPGKTPQKLQEIQQVSSHGKSKSIRNIKSIFNSEEKFRKYDELYCKETQSSLRKKRDYNDSQYLQSDQCTFRPSIDPISNLIITNSIVEDTMFSNRGVDHCTTLYLKGRTIKEEKSKKIEHQKQMAETLKLRECTFQPNANKSNYLQNKEIVIESGMYERNKKWEEDKRQRIQQELEKKALTELDGCSFRPNIRSTRQNTVSPQSSLKRHKNNYMDSIDMNGDINLTTYRKLFKQQQYTKETVIQTKSVSSFIQRFNKAEQEKIRKEKVFQKNNGQKWTGKVTKPKPFKITDIIIQNLQQRLIKNNQNFEFNNENSKRRGPINKPSKASKSPMIDKQSSRKTHIKQQMSFRDENQSLNELKEGYQQQNIDFKDALNFLHQALHELDLDE